MPSNTITLNFEELKLMALAFCSLLTVAFRIFEVGLFLFLDFLFERALYSRGRSVRAATVCK